ncbi:MAG: response regulator transcription factor [Alcanivoracaceae bacterium]|nr:response regulator transcription factor [Alcanivoracaceae bacterium]
MRILLVEDDPLLGDGLQRALRNDHYTVDWITSGAQVEGALQHDHFDLVLLDLGLPGIDGMEALRRLRASSQPVPVLILSARDQLKDRVAGLDAGADDYLMKPFDMDELRARIRARLRRTVEPPQNQLIVGPLLIDSENFSVRQNDQPVNLSRREFVLLQALARQPGRVLTRDRLEQELYGWSEDVESNALEVHVHHLRKKLGADLIRTVRGVGYQLVVS